MPRRCVEVAVVSPRQGTERFCIVCTDEPGITREAWSRHHFLGASHATLKGPEAGYERVSDRLQGGTGGLTWDHRDEITP